MQPKRPMTLLEQLHLIEQNTFDHFAFFPKRLDVNLSQIDHVHIIPSRFGSSMFNIAYGAPKKAVADTIPKVKKAFHGEPFAWWIPPTHRHPERARTPFFNQI